MTVVLCFALGRPRGFVGLGITDAGGELTYLHGSTEKDRNCGVPGRQPCRPTLLRARLIEHRPGDIIGCSSAEGFLCLDTYKPTVLAEVHQEASE
jgi:hypothetical protein